MSLRKKCTVMKFSTELSRTAAAHAMLSRVRSELAPVQARLQSEAEALRAQRKIVVSLNEKIKSTEKKEANRILRIGTEHGEVHAVRLYKAHPVSPLTATTYSRSLIEAVVAYRQWNRLARVMLDEPFDVPHDLIEFTPAQTDPDIIRTIFTRTGGTANISNREYFAKAANKGTLPIIRALHPLIAEGEWTFNQLYVPYSDANELIMYKWMFYGNYFYTKKCTFAERLKIVGLYEDARNHMLHNPAFRLTVDEAISLRHKIFYAPRWSPAAHSKFPLVFRRWVMSVLLAWKRMARPPELVRTVISLAPQPNICKH